MKFTWKVTFTALCILVLSVKEEKEVVFFCGEGDGGSGFGDNAGLGVHYHVVQDDSAFKQILKLWITSLL